MSKPAGVVFDLDGTLLETEKLARQCFVQACSDVGYPDINIDIYNQCVGTTHEATEQIMRSGYGPAFPYEAMAERWSTIYRAEVETKPVPLRPGIADLLARLQELEIAMAVATSSRRDVVEPKLQHAEINHYFEFSVCGGEAEQGKPHPAPYLMAIDRLDLANTDCWAIEDSDNGVRSAHGAGLTVFQIPDELEPSQQIRALGHEILSSALDLVDRLK